INTKLTCDGNVDIGFCENSEIFVKGDITSKQFAFCTVFCYGAVTAKGPTGVIAGGKVTSMHDVNAGIIGSMKYTPTEVYIGDGSVLFARKREAEADMKESVRIFETAVKNLAFLKQRKTNQGGTLTESQQRQFRAETQSKLFHSMRINELQVLIDKLEEDIKHKDALRANVTGKIYPGSKFIINFLTLEISDLVSHSCVTIVNDKIAALPL
ncbi:MAG: FapA family protein, partial [Oscillospiraceae bacterium]|nr:FapA family protein [Oscillospiraceae bacterium]